MKSGFARFWSSWQLSVGFGLVYAAWLIAGTMSARDGYGAYDHTTRGIGHLLWYHGSHVTVSGSFAPHGWEKRLFRHDFRGRSVLGVVAPAANLSVVVRFVCTEAGVGDELVVRAPDVKEHRIVLKDLQYELVIPVVHGATEIELLPSNPEVRLRFYTAEFRPKTSSNVSVLASSPPVSHSPVTLGAGWAMTEFVDQQGEVSGPSIIAANGTFYIEVSGPGTRQISLPFGRRPGYPDPVVRVGKTIVDAKLGRSGDSETLDFSAEIDASTPIWLSCPVEIHNLRWRQHGGDRNFATYAFEFGRMEVSEIR